MQGLLFDVRQDIVNPAAYLPLAVAALGIAGPLPSPTAGRQKAVGLFVVEAAQGELLEIVLALQLPGGLACRLHGRQQERD